MFDIVSLSIGCEVAFRYGDKWCSIVVNDGVDVSIGDEVFRFTTPREAISAPIWNGKTLSEVCEDWEIEHT